MLWSCNPRLSNVNTTYGTVIQTKTTSFTCVNLLWARVWKGILLCGKSFTWKSSFIHITHLELHRQWISAWCGFFGHKLAAGKITLSRTSKPNTIGWRRCSIVQSKFKKEQRKRDGDYLDRSIRGIYGTHIETENAN